MPCVKVCHSAKHVSSLFSARGARTLRVAAVGGALAASVVAPAQVSAVGECICYDTTWWASWYGVTEAPRNPRLLVPAQSDQHVTLATASGTAVEIEVESSGVPDLVWVKPRTLLTEGTTYVVNITDDSDAGSSAQGTSGLRFDVQADVDSTPAEATGVALEAPPGSAICDRTWGAEVQVQSISDAQQPGRRIYAQVDLELNTGSSRVFLPFMAWTQAQSQDFGVGSVENPIHCLLSRYVASARGDSSGTARVTFYDLAGNATLIDKTFEVSFANARSGEGNPSDSPSLAAPLAGGAAVSERDAGVSTVGDAGRAPNRVRGGGCATLQDTDTPRSTLAAWLAGALALVARGRRARTSAVRRQR